MNDTLRMNENDRTHQRPVSELLVEALADWGSVAPHELEVCLYDYIDPEALDQLFCTTRVGRRRAGSVTVPIDDVIVTIEVRYRAGVDISIESQQAASENDTSATYTGLSG